MTPEQAAYARGLADGRKEAANIPPDSIMLPDGTIRRVKTDTRDEEMPCAGRMDE